MDDKKELYRLIIETEKNIERRKTKRAIYVIVFYMIVYLAIDTKLKWLGIEQFFESLLVSLFFAGVTLLVNAVIFGQLIDMTRSEEQYLEYLKKQYSESKE